MKFHQHRREFHFAFVSISFFNFRQFSFIVFLFFSFSFVVVFVFWFIFVRFFVQHDFVIQICVVRDRVCQRFRSSTVSNLSTRYFRSKRSHANSSTTQKSTSIRSNVQARFESFFFFRHRNFSSISSNFVSSLFRSVRENERRLRSTRQSCFRHSNDDVHHDSFFFDFDRFTLEQFSNLDLIDFF